MLDGRQPGRHASGSQLQLSQLSRLASSRRMAVPIKKAIDLPARGAGQTGHFPLPRDRQSQDLLSRRLARRGADRRLPGLPKCLAPME